MNIQCFENDGFAVLSQVVDDSVCAEILTLVAHAPNKGVGSRGLLDLPWCKELAQTIRRHPAIKGLLREDLVAVQCTYFEKSVDQNWLVPLHQDLSIPVHAVVDHPALTGWSRKEGSVFVQPPEEVLRELVAVRLHIDECGADDGPLRVVPGSHRWGRINNENALLMRDRFGEVVCTVPMGGVLLLKPLALHGSSKAVGHSRRRVLHFVFGPRALPFGLRWQPSVE